MCVWEGDRHLLCVSVCEKGKPSSIYVCVGNGEGGPGNCTHEYDVCVGRGERMLALIVTMYVSVWGRDD